jgi:hypothetical protein
MLHIAAATPQVVTSLLHTLDDFRKAMHAPLHEELRALGRGIGGANRRANASAPFAAEVAIAAQKIDRCGDWSELLHALQMLVRVAQRACG